MIDEPLFGPHADRELDRARKRGFITHAELNALLPRREFTSREIESVFEYFRDQGIEIVET